MRLSTTEGKLSLFFNAGLTDTWADWLVFFLILLSTLGIVLPFSLNSIVSLLAYPATFLLLLYRWKKILYVLTRDWTYLGLIGLAIASITWSAAPAKTMVIVRSLINTTILVSFITASYSPKEQMQLWSKVFLTWGTVSILIELIFPSYTQFALGGANYSFWQGLFSFKLGLGTSMGLGGLLAIYSIFNSKGKDWFPIICLVFAIALIVLSESKTSLIAFAAALPLFTLRRASQQQSFQLRTAKYFAILLVSGLVIGLLIINVETIVVDLLGKDLTLTGRSDLWSVIIHQGLKRPWFGYGHGAFWFTEHALDAAFANDWPALPPSGEYFESFHSHSGFIELFVNLGFVGVGMFAANYILTLIRGLTLFFVLQREEYLWMIQIIVFMSIINFSEVGSFLVGRNLLWILYSSTVLSSAITWEQYRFQLKA